MWQLTNLSVVVAKVFIVEIFEAPKPVCLCQGSVNEGLLGQVDAILDQSIISKDASEIDSCTQVKIITKLEQSPK